ncbi:MAG: hypothetical protein ACRDD7_01425 [Peptostreptococcaceae bacterium]
MEKTYFKQLLELEPVVKNRGEIINLLYQDAIRRIVDTRFSHEEYDVCYEHTPYAKRNLDFVKELLSVE